MPPLTDTRTVSTLSDAKIILQQLAHCDCRIASETARTEKRIAALKSEGELRTQSDRQQRDALEVKLNVFILSHQDLFAKPRSVKTDFGEFGMRSATNRLEVKDGAAAIAWARENGYADMLQEITILVKDAAKKRINDGEKVPGCSLPAGERPFYKVAKSMLEAAETVAGD